MVYETNVRQLERFAGAAKTPFSAPGRTRPYATRRLRLAVGEGTDGEEPAALHYTTRTCRAAQHGGPEKNLKTPKKKKTAKVVKAPIIITCTSHVLHGVVVDDCIVIVVVSSLSARVRAKQSHSAKTRDTLCVRAACTRVLVLPLLRLVSVCPPDGIDTCCCRVVLLKCTRADGLRRRERERRERD